jgi:hypothetical protein
VRVREVGPLPPRPERTSRHMRWTVLPDAFIPRPRTPTSTISHGGAVSRPHLRAASEGHEGKRRYEAGC